MTNGASQGLFVIVAVVIFGLFIFITYMLFRNTLQPSLANIFNDSFEQVECNKLGKKCGYKDSYKWVEVAFVPARQLPISSYHARGDSFEYIHYGNNSEITVKLSTEEQEDFLIEDGYLVIKSFYLGTAGYNETAIDKDFDTSKTDWKVELKISGNPKPINFSGNSEFAKQSGFFTGKVYKENGKTYYEPLLKIKLNESTTFKITVTNPYGGKTIKDYNFKFITE